MTYNKIIQAYEYCISHEGCEDCPCVESQSACVVNRPKIALDLIKRQQAEIENYSHNNKKLTKNILDLQKALKQATSEAIKEFAERLKKISTSAVAVDGEMELYETKTYSFRAVNFDDLVKEMVGDTNDR